MLQAILKLLCACTVEREVKAYIQCHEIEEIFIPQSLDILMLVWCLNTQNIKNERRCKQ